MARKPAGTDREREDLEVLAAYERRLTDGPAAPVPLEWREEVEDYARLHQRLAALELPQVAPSVRAIVLGAAAQACEERQNDSWFARAVRWLMRPGPMLVAVTAAAVIVAVAVRPNRKPEPSAGDPSQGAVALRELPGAPEVAASAPGQPVPAAAPEAVQAEPPTMPAEEPAPAAAPPPPAPAQRLRTIEAEPASLGPAGTAKYGEKARDDEAFDEKLTKKSKAEAPEGFAAAPRKGASGQAAGLDDLERRDARKPAYDKMVQDQGDDVAGSAQAQGQFAQPPPARPVVAAQAQANAPKSPAAKDAPTAPSQAASAEADHAYAPAAEAQARARNEEAKPIERQAVSSPNREQESGARSNANTGVAKAQAKSAPESAPEPAPAAPPADKTASQVAALKAQAAKTTDPEARARVLAKLVVAAREAGDAKTEAWALGQLEQHESSVARRKAAAPAAKPSSNVERKAGSDALK